MSSDLQKNLQGDCRSQGKHKTCVFFPEIHTGCLKFKLGNTLTVLFALLDFPTVSTSAGGIWYSYFGFIFLNIGKGSPWHLVQSSPALGHSAHRCFQAIEPAFVRRQFPWSCGQSNKTRNTVTYLSTCILHAFELLGWRGAGTKQRELTPSRGFDLTTAGLLTLQRRGFCGLTHSATTSI